MTDPICPRPTCQTRRHRASLIGPMLLAGLAAGAAAQPDLDPRLRIEFELILDFDSPTPRGGEWSAFRTPGVQGDQVFFEARSRIPNPDDPNGIPQGWLGFYRYSLSAGTLTTVAEKNSPLPDGSGDVFVGGGATNDVGYGLDAGRVVFYHQYGDKGDLSGDRVAVTDLNGPLEVFAKELVTPIPGGGGLVFDTIGDVDLADGRITFSGNGPGGFGGVYVGAPGSLRPVADETMPVPGREFENFSNTTEASTGGGSVAFRDVSFASNREGVYAEIDGTLVEVVADEQPVPGLGKEFTFATFRDPVLDETGRRILLKGIPRSDAMPEGNPRGLYLYDADTNTLERIVDGSTEIPAQPGEFFFDYSSLGAAIQDDSIAFAGWQDFRPFAARAGVYLLRDGFLSKIIAPGDPLSGRVVEHAVFNREGLDGDRLAFRVRFTNDESAMFVAHLICKADLTGPGGDGVPDGTLTADDFFFYLGLFAAGDLAADLTGPGGDGIPDGALTADDFFFYLARFAAGCP